MNKLTDFCFFKSQQIYAHTQRDMCVCLMSGECDILAQDSLD